MPNLPVRTIANTIENVVIYPSLPYPYDMTGPIFSQSETILAPTDTPPPPSSVKLLLPIATLVKPGSLEQVNETDLKGAPQIKLDPHPISARIQSRRHEGHNRYSLHSAISLL